MRFAAGWFTRGLVTFTTGANAGRAVEVKRHAAGMGIATLELWQAPVAARSRPATTFVVTAGCDKQFATCRRQVRQRRQLPRLPAHARQRLRHRDRAHRAPPNASGA